MYIVRLFVLFLPEDEKGDLTCCVAGDARTKPHSETEQTCFETPFYHVNSDEIASPRIFFLQQTLDSSSIIPAQYCSQQEAGLMVKDVLLSGKHCGSSVVKNSLFIGLYSKQGGGGQHSLNACDMVTVSKI